MLENLNRKSEFVYHGNHLEIPHLCIYNEIENQLFFFKHINIIDRYYVRKMQFVTFQWQRSISLTSFKQFHYLLTNTVG